MKFLPRIISAVLTCAVVSALWACANTQVDSASADTQLTLTQDQVRALYEKAAAGDLAALGTLKVQAQKGNAVAQDRMGVLYANGKGVWRDDRQAMQWFRKAAEQGYAPAQASLGTRYYYGQGVARDYDQAAQWLRKAAEQGNFEAQLHLFFLYINGWGVPRNKVVAYALYGVGSSNVDASPFSPGEMTAQEIADGKALRAKMSEPGNLLKALDEYIAAHPSGSH